MATETSHIFYLSPSETYTALRANHRSNQATMVWGPPGIGKSSIGLQLANNLGIAYIDMRLAQIDPVDLRGVPMKSFKGGVHGVTWATPFILPRDIDLTDVVTIDYDETVNVEFYNPKSSANHIHYCTSPNITVVSLTKGLTAEIVERNLDNFSVRLVNTDGEHSKGSFRWRVTGEAKAILNLDEFSSAPPSITAVCFELVLERRIGEYQIPDGVFIIAMGNRETDRGIVYKMPTPMASRFQHITMREDWDEFNAYAIKTQMHPVVVGYLAANKADLFTFKPQTGSLVFACPRTWEFVSKTLWENDQYPIADNILKAQLAGTIGESTALTFVAHHAVYKDLPNNDDILSGKLKMLPKKADIALAATLSTSICYELNYRLNKVKKLETFRNKVTEWKLSEELNDWRREVDTFIKFCFSNLDPETFVVVVISMLREYLMPIKPSDDIMPNFKIFVETYKDILLDKKTI